MLQRSRPPALRSLRPVVPLLALVALPLASSCGGGGGGDASNDDSGGSAATLRMTEVTNGFGPLLPHRARALDGAGQPTGQIVPLRSFDAIAAHVRRGNPVLPPPSFPADAVLPTGDPGNHFVAARFSRPVDPATVVDAATAGGAAALSRAVSATQLDPLTGTALPLGVRAFVGGRTLVGPPAGDPPRLRLERWVEHDPDTGRLVALVPEAAGFPGVASPIPGARDLVDPRTVVLVADTDADLRTFETFPGSATLRFRVTTALRAVDGEPLEAPLLATTHVGADDLGPEVLTTPPPLDEPLITPGGGDVDVDPRTTVRVEFTESVQPFAVGPLLDAGDPGTSSSVRLAFGPSTMRATVPFSVRPASPFDLATYELFPAYSFPGQGPAADDCGTFARVDVDVEAGQLEDLAQVDDGQGGTGGNRNLLGASTFFVTGEGPGVVNAPVAPDAVYLLRAGARPGLSVLDLNGYGAGTGSPQHDPLRPAEGESKLPFDPNVSSNPGLLPPVSAGSCTIDGGSAGVFTLTRDSALDDRLVRSPIVASVGDVHVGRALDQTFNNAPFPFGCQAGGGSNCALDGRKVVRLVATASANTVRPPQPTEVVSPLGNVENVISWSPHPNPPPLVFPPLCIAPTLGAQEPTSVDNAGGNLLVPGDAFGRPNDVPPVPPSGLLTVETNQYFLGPTIGSPPVTQCSEYMIRQQVGHYLYVADRARGEVVVLNSNRMTVIDRIPVPDPTSMAMGPNLDLLGLTNQLAGTVTFVGIDPNRPDLHRVVRTTVVGDGPRGIAWEPTNEDVLVCSELAGTLTVIGAQDLGVRRVVRSQLTRPFEVCVTPRMVTGMAFGRNVYLAYVLDRDGSVAVFESGPNGVNGWGFDDVIGVVPFTFRNPKTIQLDPLHVDASVYVVHEGPIDPLTGAPGPAGEGAISRLHVESAVSGQLPLQLPGLTPNFRDMEFGVPLSLGEDSLSGVPVDVAFDDQRNLGALSAPSTTFSAGSGVVANGKQNYRVVGATIHNACESQFLLAAVPNPVGGTGVVDVIRIGATGAPRVDVNPYRSGVQSVDAPDVTAVASYWRQ